MRYRAEIDGLRAVAVIPVILFHAGFKTFSGGFIGVDVFFVISGYLITTILLAELEAGRFSLTGFYERRARRILPALGFVLLACLPIAWLWLLPSDLSNFSESLISVALFASNIFFWRDSGYFSAAAELKPLLHTWSLAVEEQFYILFPVCLMLAWRLGRRIVFIGLILLTIASLSLAQWGAFHKPLATFFLLPTRGWELAIGAIIAFYPSQREKTLALPNVLSHLPGLAGLLLIAYGVFSYNQYTPYPGVYALAPTVGAALLILYAHPGTLAGMLLGSRVLVGVGLISYSAYLWHQPLFSFARHRSFTEPGPLFLIALSALALILGYLSWRFVETPFRNRNKVTRTSLWVFSSTTLGMMLAAGVAIYAVTPDDENVLQSEAERLYRVDSCFFNYDQSFQTLLDSGCDKPGSVDSLNPVAPDRSGTYVLYGDSIAAHMYTGLIKELGKESIIQLTSASCRAIRSTNEARCDEFYDWFLDQYVPNNEFGAIIVSSNWFKEYEKLGELAFRQKIRDLFMKMKGHRVIVYSQPTSLHVDVSRYIQKLQQYGLTPPNDLDITTDNLAQVNAALRQEASESGFEFIDTSKYFCSLKTCRVVADGVFYFWDTVHLTKAGSIKLAEQTRSLLIRFALTR